MYSDEQVLELIRAVDVPPTTVDVGQAKVSGRRRARQQRVLAVAAVALVVAGGTGYVALRGTDRPAQVAGRPGADCTVDLVAGQGVAGAVDPSGKTIVGTVRTPAGQPIAVRFEGGRAVPYPGATGTAVAINTSGLLIGYDTVYQPGTTLAWEYVNGTKTMLAKLPGYAYSIPRAVSSHGDIVGAAIRAGDDSRPVIWPADQPGTVRDEAMPADFGAADVGGSTAVGVADDWTVVGEVRGEPTRWSADATPTALPIPSGYRLGAPAAMRGHYVYGWLGVVGENRKVAVRWDDLTRGAPKILTGAPYDVVDGTPDGWAITAGGDNHAPTRVSPSGAVEKLPVDTGAVARSISDDGRTIVGSTWGENPRPVIWHC